VSERGIPVEERLDAIYRLVAILFLGVGAVHGIGALRDVLATGSVVLTVATPVRSAFIVIIPLLCLWVVWRAVSLKARAGRGAGLAAGGFVRDAILRAAVTAGLATYITLVAMHGASDDTLLPVKFYLNSAMAVMTITFGVSYLVRTTVSAEGA
jgi:hypothetical protein